jgi:hypothetical protein
MVAIWAGFPVTPEHTKRPKTTDGPTLLTTLTPNPPPRKAARRTRKPVTFANLDYGSRRAAEDVQFLVVSRCGCAVAGLVLFVVGHLLP